MPLSLQSQSGLTLRKKALFCHSERSEESLFDLTLIKAKKERFLASLGMTILSFSAACEAVWPHEIRNGHPVPRNSQSGRRNKRSGESSTCQGCGISRNGFPLLLEYFGLNLKIPAESSRVPRFSNREIERDAKRRLRHRGKPAGKHVFAAFPPSDCCDPAGRTRM